MPAVSQVLVSGQPITTIGVSPANDAFRIAGTRNGRVFMSNTVGATTMTDVTDATHAGAEPGRTRTCVAR